MRGELDWIVMKALEKDRNRRYESASTFAADVQRYLADEPVLACPPSAWYRLRKFARRKKTALVIAACVFLALAGVAGGIGWAIRDKAARDDEIEHKRLAREAEIERDRLVREAALDQTVESTLSETGPLIDQEKWPEALAVVERADKLLDAAGRTERPQRLVQLQRELTMAQRLEDIYTGATLHHKPMAIIAVGSGTEHKLQAEPDSFEGEFFWGRAQDGEFAQAFRDFGIDLEALPSAEAAQIGRRSIGTALIKALDQWAPLRRRARGAHDHSWKKLLEVAGQADPDKWRNDCRAALLRGDRQALEKLAASIDIREVTPATLWLLGNDLVELGARDQGVALLRRAQQQYPDDVWINDYLGWFYRTRFQPPRYDDALHCYSIVVALRPRRWMNHSAIGDVLKAKGAVEAAIAAYTRAIEVEPYHAQPWFRRARAYEELHQYDKAVADCSRAIELDPKDAAAWVNRGAAYHELHQYDKAIADSSKGIDLDPKDATAWINRGCAHYELHQYDKALADLNEAIKLDPNRSSAWNCRGCVHRHLRQYDKAVADCSKAIELDVKNAMAWSSRGNAYTLIHENEKAIADCSKAIDLDANNPSLWNNRGAAYLWSGHYDEAISDFNKAIEVDPKDAMAWANRGMAYGNLRQYDKAIDDCSKAVELDPKNTFGWNNRGGMYIELHQYDKAVADCSRAIELDPNQAPPWNNRGFAYAWLHQYDKAIADYSKAIELDPKLAPAWNNRGTAYAQLGQWQKAALDLAKVTELQKNHVSGWYQRAVLCLKLGDGKAYRQVCRAMLDSFGGGPPDAAGLVVWTCALGPDAGVESVRVVELAEKLAAQNAKNRSDQANLGAALYRAGQFKEAVRQLDKAAALPADSLQPVEYAWFFLAMAHQRLGRAEEARQWLEKARKQMEQKSSADAPWNRRLSLQLLRGEAEGLLGIKDEKTPHQNTKDTKKQP
jgi:tetratricopeptide (TPR) repeat protein